VTTITGRHAEYLPLFSEGIEPSRQVALLFLRSLHVALQRPERMKIAPGYASCTPNCGPHQEYKGDGDTTPVACDTSSLKSENGALKIPSGPGLGIKFDPAFVNKAVAVSA
jgi:hypothetical protein